jgi:hypothetical protein
VQASFVAAAPPTDPNAAAEINQQMQEADQAEKEVLAETQSATAAKPPAIAVSVAPVELKLGQTVDEVTAIFGPPTTIVVAGAQEICVYKSTYKGMKATFKDGRLVDIN